MRRTQPTASGFTLLEVSVVVIIIAILAALAVPVVSKLRARADRVKCSANLRNLAIAANQYVQQHNAWPQIAPPGGGGGTEEEVAEKWIKALEPFGATRATWICPTIQNLLQNPDYSTPENARIDYLATPFDDKPTSPHEWPRQPWFIEAGDVHGNGNLIIFTDGSIGDMETAIKEAASGQ